jgi:hypothetical protein
VATETLMWPKNGPLCPAAALSWAMWAVWNFALKAGDGSPLPPLAPLPIGICPSIQCWPPSKEVKNPVGTRAWSVAPMKVIK